MTESEAVTDKQVAADDHLEVNEDDKVSVCSRCSQTEAEPPVDKVIGPYKFGTILCCIFNLALFILLVTLMWSFMTGGRVYTTVVGEDTRYDEALACVPFKGDEEKVCGILGKSEPMPEGYRMMTT